MLPLCLIFSFLSSFVSFICAHLSLSPSLSPSLPPSLSSLNLAALVPRETSLFPWQCLQAEQRICLKLDKIRVSFIPLRHTHTYTRYGTYAHRRAENTEKHTGKRCSQTRSSMYSLRQMMVLRLAYIQYILRCHITTHTFLLLSLQRHWNYAFPSSWFQPWTKPKPWP